jgi:hypothetical protein
VRALESSTRHHWQELTALKLDALLNAFTKHFVIFALKFRYQRPHLPRSHVTYFEGDLLTLWSCRW